MPDANAFLEFQAHTFQFLTWIRSVSFFRCIGHFRNFGHQSKSGLSFTSFYMKIKEEEEEKYICSIPKAYCRTLLSFMSLIAA